MAKSRGKLGVAVVRTGAVHRREKTLVTVGEVIGLHEGVARGLVIVIVIVNVTGTGINEKAIGLLDEAGRGLANIEGVVTAHQEEAVKGHVLEHGDGQKNLPDEVERGHGSTIVTTRGAIDLPDEVVRDLVIVIVTMTIGRAKGLREEVAKDLVIDLVIVDVLIDHRAEVENVGMTGTDRLVDPSRLQKRSNRKG